MKTTKRDRDLAKLNRAACPRCGAAKGEPCRNADGTERTTRRGYASRKLHAERDTAIADAVRAMLGL